MRLIAAFACAVLLICLGVVPGHADKRVALVIGNSNYQHAGRLGNPAGDAAAVAALLKASGFQVVERRSDVALAEMHRAIGDFADAARDADIAIVYYAGHGIEVDGVNYLIPTDARLVRDFDVEAETISLDRVLRAIDSARRLRLVILDACRENPFAQSMKRSSRAVGRGFARVEPAAPDTLVAFAAKAGSIASDGDGANSPFTAALLKHLATPGLDVRLALGLVRDEVMETTRPRQEPFVYGSLGGRTVAIVDAPAGARPAIGPPAALNEAAQAWAEVRDTKSQAVLEAFVKRYGDSFYADIARARLDELKRVAVVGPPVVSAVPAGPCGGVTLAALSSRAAQPLSANEECALKPKEVFKECEKCPEMVLVPAGSFTMGSPASEAGRDDAEDPPHLVTIGKPFAVGKFHVTVDQFAEFVAEAGYDPGSKCHAFEGGKWEEKQGISWRKPGFAQTGLHPAVCLNWNDAKAYVAWLAKKTGKTYRLLAEAEWEYAARSGTATRYSFGNDEKDLCRYGNGADETAKSEIADAQKWQVVPCSDGYAYTAPVGSFLPNRFGLYDMHGNASQWVEDCWHQKYQGAPSDGSAWTTGDCSSHALRGGSWFIAPSRIRSAYRIGYPAENRNIYGGFRVARTL